MIYLKIIIAVGLAMDRLLILMITDFGYRFINEPEMNGPGTPSTYT